MMVRTTVSFWLYLIALYIFLTSVGGLMGIRIQLGRFTEYKPLTDIEDVHNIYWSLLIVVVAIVVDYIDVLNEKENERIKKEEEKK